MQVEHLPKGVIGPGGRVLRGPLLVVAGPSCAALVVAAAPALVLLAAAADAAGVAAGVPGLDVHHLCTHTRIRA